MASRRRADEHQTRLGARRAKRRAPTGSRSRDARRRSRLPGAASTSASEDQVALRRRDRCRCAPGGRPGAPPDTPRSASDRPPPPRCPAPGRCGPRARRSLPRLATRTRRRPGRSGSWSQRWRQREVGDGDGEVAGRGFDASTQDDCQQSLSSRIMKLKGRPSARTRSRRRWPPDPPAIRRHRHGVEDRGAASPTVSPRTTLVILGKA